LPKKLISRFVLILHLTHKIIGNLDLTAKCLEVILEEEVKINISRKSLKEKDLAGIPGKKNAGLGSCVVGEDFICGNYVSDYDPVMEFIIGPLKNSSIEDFLENGSYSRFLSCFYSFFVPIEMEAVTIIKANETRQHFVLNDSSSNVILGYNSSI
jgi:predicted component of type VI protein secretion system